MFRVTYEPPPLKELSGFIADMHFHSCYSHDCDTPVKDIVQKARRLGIYVAITDHNRIGGVMEAQKYKDAPIIPGIELCSREGKEVIAYFTTAKKLSVFFEKHIAPHLKDKNALRGSSTPIPMALLLDILSAHDCLVHVPHPFGSHPRKSFVFFSRKKNRHLLEAVHSVEIFNQQVMRRANLSAAGWAVQLEKGVAGGSDGHDLKHMGGGVTVSKARTIAEHLRNVRLGDVHVYGKELKQAERMIGFARTTVKNKLRNGVKGGIQKGIHFLAGEVSAESAK